MTLCSPSPVRLNYFREEPPPPLLLLLNNYPVSLAQDAQIVEHQASVDDGVEEVVGGDG